MPPTASFVEQPTMLELVSAHKDRHGLRSAVDAAASGSGHRMISRRRFLTTGSAALLATPVIAEAQQAARVARIGWLWADVTGPLPNWAADAFREKLRDEGWFEGRNLVIEFRHGGAESLQAERLKALAR